jgi:hypothetical protein
MTGDQSRLLKVGDRVRWGATTTDLGTVVETTWNGVTIDWDDGNAGFSHRQWSLEIEARTFWAENSQKSPAESKKTPVFWRLALETLE